MIRRILGILLLSATVVATAVPQVDPRVQAVNQFFSGQNMLVTYRQGGAVYGKYFFLRVDFCPSGNYFLAGESRKQSSLNSTETYGESSETVNRWRDRGKWEAVNLGGQVGIRYRAASGALDFIPVSFLPNGSVKAGNGVSVVRRGLANCR